VPQRIDERKIRGTTRYVFGVLVLAAAWEEEFPDRWVGEEEVLKYANLGPTPKPELVRGKLVERAGDDATRQAFYRSRKKLLGLPWLRIREDPGRARVRLVGDLSADFHDWLYDYGKEVIKKEHWDRFIAASVPPPESADEASDRLEAAVARQMVIQGRTSEAIAMIRESLRRSKGNRHEMALRLAWTFAVIRSGDVGEFKRAERVLKDLASRPIPPGSLNDRLLKARIRVELAYCRFLSRLVRNVNPWSVTRHVKACRDLLEEARRFQAGLSPGDAAQVENVSALVTKCLAYVSKEPDRDRLYEEANAGFRRAFSLAESVGDTFIMGATLYNLGELCYARYRIDLREPSEAQAQEALDWYRQSCELTERFGTNRDLYLDYARVADVLGVIIAIRARSGALDGLDVVLSKAEAHLDRVREHGNPLEQQLVDWTDNRLSQSAKEAGLRRRALTE